VQRLNKNDIKFIKITFLKITQSDNHTLEYFYKDEVATSTKYESTTFFMMILF